MLLGGVLTYGVLAPALVADGLVANVTYKDIVGWTVWPGAAMLVASGLTSFVLDWRSVARAFSGITRIFRKRRVAPAPIEAYEWFKYPSWLRAALLLANGAVVALMLRALVLRRQRAVAAPQLRP